MNKPSIQDMMKSVYYLYLNKYIDYAELLAVLAERYNVHHVEEDYNKFTCYYDRSKMEIWI